MELGECVLHQFLNLVVAQVADASLVGVVNVLVGLKLASLDFQSDFLVSITERSSVGSQLVYFFYREHRVVARIVEYVLVHFHLVDDVGSHLQAVFQLAEGREEHLLDDLQVAEVAYT